MSTDKREQIAHHEAGHAVAQVMRGAPMIDVKLDPARVRARRNQFVHPLDEAVIMFAGPIAEAKYLGATYDLNDARIGDDRDLDEAINSALLDLGKGVRPRDFYVWLSGRQHEATRMIESAWPAVQRVARALVKRGSLTEKEVKAIVFRPRAAPIEGTTPSAARATREVSAPTPK